MPTLALVALHQRAKWGASEACDNMKRTAYHVIFKMSLCLETALNKGGPVDTYAPVRAQLHGLHRRRLQP